MEDRSGQRLDKYHLIRLLGTGSFGEVYLAEQVYRKTQVAVKVLPQLANDDIAGFLNEARTVVLRHPNIVQVLDFGIDNRIPFIVMEYIPNGTLRQLYPNGTRIPLDDLISYIKQIADALNYAHDENLIHRDVKPENILLRLNKEVLLSDFGIATIARSSHSQSVLKMAGTLAYMAPEQIEGKPVLASDQYALGIIVYEYLTGERPFNGGPIEVATQHIVTPPPSLRSKVPTLSPDIEQVVLTALAKGPSKRFANVRAFAHALAQASKPPKQPDPVVPNLISPVPSLTTPPLPSLPKKQTINATPLSNQQSNIFSPNTILPTSEKPSLAPSPLSVFFETSPPIVQSEISPVGRRGSTIATAPQPVMRAAGNKRSRLFYPSLVLVALLILGVIGGGAYLYQTLNSNSHADTHLQDAQSLITKATNEAATNPTLALADLANAQKMLRSVQQNSSFSDTQRHKALGLLQGDLTRSVQQAITSYNKQSAITALCSSYATETALNIGSTSSQPSAIAMVQGKSTTALYALGEDSKVYQRVNNNSLLLVPLPLSSIAKVQGMASNGSQLVLLVAQPIEATPNFTYSLNLLPVEQPTQVPQNSNQLKFAASVTIDPLLLPNGQTPQLIASTSTDVYVVIDAGATQSTVQILDYAPNKAGKALAQVTSFPFTFSRAIVSMAAFPNHQLFFLLADGSIQSLQFATTNQAPTSVFVQNAIAQPLANSGVPFTWQMSVPTVTPGGSKSLSVPGTTSTSALAVSLVGKVPHLFVMDVMLNRILELTPVGDSVATAATGTTTITPPPKSTSTGGGAISDATPITLSLVKQYASSPLFTQGKSLAVDTQGANVNVLTQSSATSSPNVVAFSTNAPTGCV